MKLGLFEGSFRLSKPPNKSGAYWLTSFFRIGILGNLAAIAVVAVPLWRLPPGTGIRPMILPAYLMLIELITALAGIVRGFRCLRANPPIAAILLWPLALGLALSPIFVGFRVMIYIASRHHLIIED
jgi:hypothetical protein